MVLSNAAKWTISLQAGIYLVLLVHAIGCTNPLTLALLYVLVTRFAMG